MLGCPRHVGFIMDGNRRWALRRGLPAVAGHEAGVRAARAMIEMAPRLGVETVTLYGFSSDNWRRSADEVSSLMDLFQTSLETFSQLIRANNLRFCWMGEPFEGMTRLNEALQSLEESTRENKGLKLVVALNYSGRGEIVRAAQRAIQERLSQETLSLQDSSALASSIQESDIDAHLDCPHLSPLDLVIRTSGQSRLSNFMLWQAAYSEFFFSSILWPDFTVELFQKACEQFSCTRRSFGGD